MSSGGVVDAFGPGEIHLPPGPHDPGDPEDPQFVGPPSQIPDLIDEVPPEPLSQ